MPKKKKKGLGERVPLCSAQLGLGKANIPDFQIQIPAFFILFFNLLLNSISAAKPLGDGLFGHFVVNTTELYKYMESDGYPVSVTPAMLSDLRVELREYQQQVCIAFIPVLVTAHARFAQ